MGGNQQGHHPVAGRMFPLAAQMALSADPASVVSGASATIVSDALMNPFDGESLPIIYKAVILTIYSHQTTHASTWVTS